MMKIDRRRTAQTLVMTFCLAVISHAEVLTVDNRPNAVAMYTDLGAAIDAAAAGDTLQLAGSATSYGRHDVFKPLHFRGPGYYLTENNVPGLNREEATAELTFRNDPSLGNASGSTLRHLSGSAGSTSDERVEVSLDYFRGSVFGGSSSSKLIVNVRRSWLTQSGNIFEGSSFVNSIFQSFFTVRDQSSIDKCIFLSGDRIRTDALGTISDSIFITGESPQFTFLQNHKGTVSHCLAVNSTYLPDGNGNLNGSFAFETFSPGESPDGYYRLSATSLAKGAGRNGGDLGAFAGPNPYRLSGLPTLPRITVISIDAVATDANGLNFTVEAVSSGTTPE